MKVLGIDYGDRRTGIAISDRSGLLAGNPQVIDERDYEKLLDKLCALVAQEKIEQLVLGYPKNMDGTIGERAARCEVMADDLRARTGCSVKLWDERRTTVQAHAILHSNGQKQKKHKKTVDAVAAMLILQGYLDYMRANKEDRI